MSLLATVIAAAAEGETEDKNALIKGTPGLMIWTLIAVPLVGISAVFYVFEVVIVVSIQAFILAALSAIYIGSAIEPEH